MNGSIASDTEANGHYEDVVVMEKAIGGEWKKPNE